MIFAYSILIIVLAILMDQSIRARRWKVVAAVAISLIAVVMFASATANFVLEHRSYGYYRRY